MVFSYCTSALSRWAWASLTPDFSFPAVKMGCEICGTRLQALAGPLNRLVSCVLCPPRNPLRLSCGK